MLFTTTDTLQGQNIRKYFGVVTGISIAGTSFVKDFFARIKDFTGGRVRSYESDYKEAKIAAMQEAASKAEQLGANAVIGLRFDQEVIAFQKTAMIMVSCQGTAVLIEENP